MGVLRLFALASRLQPRPKYARRDLWAFVSVLEFLLGPLFVVNPLDGELRHVQWGSRMGPPHSGEVTDAALHAEIEMPLLTAERRKALGVLA